MELRLYSWVNGLYLSSIQAGIQTGHAAVDLVRKYTDHCPNFPKLHVDQARMVEEWADLHKTFIILNGANNAGLKSAEKIAEACGYPFTTFHEDEESLGGLLTCVAVVLPESVFSARLDSTWSVGTLELKLYVNEYEDEDGKLVRASYGPGHPLHPLIELLRSSKLAT